METESLPEPPRYLTLSETAPELTGDLEVPDPPVIATGYADIYRGIWKTDRGDRIDVAIKQLKTLIPPNRHSDLQELQRKANKVGTSGPRAHHGRSQI